MDYEEALDAFIKRITAERDEIFRQIKLVEPWTEASGNLMRELDTMQKKHDREFQELRAKYHLPPPKVVSSISSKSENDNNEKKY